MARTEMFRKLQALVAIAAEADARGVDVAEAHGRAASAAVSDEGLTRRELLKRSAIAGAGLSALGSAVLSPKAAWGASKPPVQPRIAIVGAGISGMSAAMTLKDAGFTNVTVFEASQRIGGRTWTNASFWSGGQWSEWGGELIDTGHKTVFALCQRFGFSLYDLAQDNPAGATDILWFGGGYYPWLTMAQEWQACGASQVVNSMMQTMPPWPWPYDAAWSDAAKAIDNMTLAQWIDSTIPGGRASRLGSFIDVAYNIEFGEETSRMGAANLLGLLGFSSGNGPGGFWIYGKSDERYKVRGGNQQISLAQADYVGPDAVRFGMTMTALQRNRDGSVTLTFSSAGKTVLVTADRVVLALPLGVLKRIKAAGGLANAWADPLKDGTIDMLGFGANNKLQLEIADRFWVGSGPWPGVSDGESYGDTGFQEAWHVTNGMPGTTGIINNYTGGDVARLLNGAPKPFADTSDASARAYVQKAAKTFLAQIEPVFPGMTAKWTGKATLSVWAQSPTQWGAYSYWTPGYLQRYCTYERVQLGPVHFAGEHCSQDFQGYVEGGAVEGIRAANEVVAAYK